MCHIEEVISIWGTATDLYEMAMIPTVQSYWTGFIRTSDPNTFRLSGSPVWETWTGTEYPSRRQRRGKSAEEKGKDHVPSSNFPSVRQY